MKPILRHSWIQVAFHVAFVVAALLVPHRLVGGSSQVLSWLGTTNAFLDIGVPYPLDAVSSSGLPVSLTVEAGPATLAAGMLTAKGAGTILVSAEQAGDATVPAARITRRFNLLHAGFSENPSSVPLHSGSRIRIVGNSAFLTVPGPWSPDTPLTGELRVLDTSDLNHPSPVSTLSVNGWIGSVEISGGLVCLSVEYRDGGLPGVVHILDIRQPGNPVLLGTFVASRRITQIRWVENRLYVAEAALSDLVGEALEIVDLSQPSHPVKLGGYGFGEDFLDIEIAGTTAYAAGSPNGLAILDLQDPAHPIRRDPGDLKGELSGVTLSGGLAYLTGTLGETRGIHVVDVADASHPRFIRSLPLTEYPQKLQIHGSQAFVLETRPPNKATGSISRLHTLDLTDPRDPVDIGIYENRNAYNGFNVLGGSIYLGLQQRMFAPPYPADSPTITLRYGRPQNLRHNTPDSIPFTRSPISNLVASDTDFPIRWTVLNGPVSEENGQLRLEGLGPVRIRVEQAGNEMYLPAVEEWAFTISPPPLGLRRSPDGLEAYWADGLTGLRLEQSGGLASTGTWETVVGDRTHTDGEERIRLTAEDTQRWFRLVGP